MASLMLATIFSTVNVNAAVDSDMNAMLNNYTPSGNLDSGTSTDVTDILLPPTDSSSGAPGNYYAVLAGCVRYEDPSANLPMPSYKLKNLYQGGPQLDECILFQCLDGPLPLRKLSRLQVQISANPQGVLSFSMDLLLARNS